jgi:hypothetical protein
MTHTTTAFLYTTPKQSTTQLSPFKLDTTAQTEPSTTNSFLLPTHVLALSATTRPPTCSSQLKIKTNTSSAPTALLSKLSKKRNLAIAHKYDWPPLYFFPITCYN